MGSVDVDFIGGVTSRIVAHSIGLSRCAIYFHYEAFSAVVVMQLLNGLHGLLIAHRSFDQ